MRKLAFLAGTAAALIAASPAMAAVTITSAALTGPSGTVWNTAVDSYYTLFIQRPLGNVFNPNDNFSGAPVSNPVAGEFDYSINGDGFPTAVRSSTPSDPFYTLTLKLTDGVHTGTLTGVFTEATSIFAPTSPAQSLGGNLYSLTDFTWTRTLSNTVGAFSSTNTAPIGPGSRADYTGAFTLVATPVPEPATWAMMIGGFGLVGGAMRARRKTTVSFA